MVKHKIEIGDILECGEIKLNDKTKIPDYHKVVGIKFTNGYLDFLLRPFANMKEHEEWSKL